MTTRRRAPRPSQKPTPSAPKAPGKIKTYAVGAAEKVKNTAKRGLEGYLKVTNKMADKISEKLPSSMTERSYSSRGSRGRGRSSTR
jgi:hypothetical protein